MRRFFPLALLTLLPACGGSDDPRPLAPILHDAASDSLLDAASHDASPVEGGDGSTADGAQGDAPTQDAPVEAGPTSCDFGYETMFPAATPSPGAPRSAPSGLAARARGTGQIAHADPAPPSHKLVPVPSPVPEPSYIVMPEYQDNMPLFERGTSWATPTRCYETPTGVRMLTEAEAFDLYAAIAAETTGVPFPTKLGQRSVVGLRGAYPGTFAWHGNAPNHFNDTLALLWLDTNGDKHLREFPVNTDTGAHDFGTDSSSSLRPNRRYHHANGWHKTYNALHIAEVDYRVRDDTNTNGHWDSDRNGWLPPDTGEDHDRTGGGHNIHMGSVDGPLGSALVDNWSAGCQVIPGMANWTEFINNAWTQEGDPVSYYLIDTRDIAPEIWHPCTPDGSHSCPLRIDTFPYSDTRDTASGGASQFPVYNCSAADESGAEFVYVIRVDKQGTLTVSVDCTDPVDIDVHLLEGDSANACLARADKTFTYDLAPGRYLIVADTFVSAGAAKSGAYTLNVDFK